MKLMTRDHSFSSHAKFSEKQHFGKFCVRTKPQCKKTIEKETKTPEMP